MRINETALPVLLNVWTFNIRCITIFTLIMGMLYVFCIITPLWIFMVHQ